jgi:hypothetical protein
MGQNNLAYVTFFRNFRHSNHTSEVSECYNVLFIFFDFFLAEFYQKPKKKTEKYFLIKQIMQKP